MRSKAGILTGMLVLITALGLAGERKVLEAIVVRVNDRIVTISDFRERLLQDISQRPDPPTDSAELRAFAERIFQAVTEELVLLEHAQSKKIVVDEDQVDEAIKALREENNLQEDAAFEAALASTGMTEEILRQRYRETITLQRAVRSEVKPVEITEEEMRQRYEAERERFRVPPKVALQQLFFPVQESENGRDDRDAVRRRAQGLVERVSGGSDLAAEATLAGVELQDLGAIPVDDMRPDLADALKEMNKGEFSRPLYVPGGYQVVRLVERIPPGFQPFEEVKDELRRDLSIERFEEQSGGLLENLKQEFLVETHPELIELALAGLGNV